MKIIIVGTAYPYRGGLAAFNERMALQFEQSGNSVEVVTFTLQYPDFLFPGKTQFSTEKQGNNLKIKRLINTVNPISWYKAYRYILNQKPDAVIFCYWMFFVAPAYNFIAQKIHMPVKTLENIENGHGKIITFDGDKVGVYKDNSGKAYAVSTKCPHLGCELKWNSDDLSWDCPCHGSRFDYKGNLLDSPSIKDLKYED